MGAPAGWLEVSKAVSSKKGLRVTAALNAPIVVIPQDCGDADAPVLAVDLGKLRVKIERDMNAHAVASPDMVDSFSHASYVEATRGVQFNDHAEIEATELCVGPPNTRTHQISHRSQSRTKTGW